MTEREQAIFEIEAADDPQEYEKAIDFALKALKTDVPRENIDKMIGDIILKLPKVIIKDFDGKETMFCNYLEVIKVISDYCGYGEGVQNGKT